MLRHLGLSQSKPIDELAHGGLIRAECAKKCTTAAFRDSIERIGCRRRAGHAVIICSYRDIASPGATMADHPSDVRRHQDRRRYSRAAPPSALVAKAATRGPLHHYR